MRADAPTEDYYTILGVRDDADAAELKRAFRRRARELHPDLPTVRDDDHRFRELTAVYDVLSDPAARARYDRLERGRRRALPSSTSPLDLELEWYEASISVSKSVSYAERIPCVICGGRGHPGEAPVECPRCRGEGVVQKASSDGSAARLIQVEDCPACDGRGHQGVARCVVCGGNGSETLVRTIRVRVPPGVADGDLLEFDGIPQRFRIRLRAQPTEPRSVLPVAVVGLVCALALLLYLLLAR